MEERGTISSVSGQAQLREHQSFLISLQQRFTLQGGAERLSFDVFFGPGFDLTEDFIPDAFEVQLLGDDGESVVPTWDDLATSFFNVQEDLTQNLADGVTVQPIEGTGVPASHVVLDLTGVPTGTIVTLYVDLIGADADTESGVRVDNFAINDQIDPGPGGGSDDGDGDDDDADEGTLTIACPPNVALLLCPSDLVTPDEVPLDAPVVVTDESVTFRVSDDRPLLLFEEGLTEITFTVTDDSSRVATCVTTVEVSYRDAADPECRFDTNEVSIVCPPAVVVDVPSDRIATPEFVGLGEPDVSGPAGVAVTDDAPDEFSSGVTTVTFTATSPSGATVSCVTDVLVRPVDPEGPQEVPPDFQEIITTTTRNTGALCGSCGAIGVVPFFIMVATLVTVKHRGRGRRASQQGSTFRKT